MSSPLVSVICLCYNQERFVREAIESVIGQTYSNVELIVVDDASTDNSVGVIREIVSQHPKVQFLALKENVGNCKAFNRGLALAKGYYMIDLAADDILFADRINKGVIALRDAGPTYGVTFSDAEWISESGDHLSFHSDRFPHATVPQGDIYKDLVERFFICSPTVMFSRPVIESLGGYDEMLTYEDFDFWIRSSRNFLYTYTPEVLVKKRVVKKSLSDKQFRLFSHHGKTTFRVCEKIFRLNRTSEERRALRRRIRYEVGLNIRLLNFVNAFRFLRLAFKNGVGL
jgi:glycosyltransferase involved in cell wall biosynthesis